MDYNMKQRHLQANECKRFYYIQMKTTLLHGGESMDAVSYTHLNGEIPGVRAPYPAGRRKSQRLLRLSLIHISSAMIGRHERVRTSKPFSGDALGRSRAVSYTHLVRPSRGRSLPARSCGWRRSRCRSRSA